MGDDTPKARVVTMTLPRCAVADCPRHVWNKPAAEAAELPLFGSRSRIPLSDKCWICAHGQGEPETDHGT